MWSFFSLSVIVFCYVTDQVYIHCKCKTREKSLLLIKTHSFSGKTHMTKLYIIVSSPCRFLAVVVVLKKQNIVCILEESSKLSFFTFICIKDSSFSLCWGKNHTLNSCFIS